MNQTTFTLLGFTQPQTALPIIRNAENNAKGFTSRILWYFPTPIFRRFAESELTEEEKELCEEWEEHLGNYTSPYTRILISLFNAMLKLKVYEIVFAVPKFHQCMT